MVGANPQQALPSTQQQFVDRNGLVTYPWYRLLLTLWNRTGGSTGETSGQPSVVSSTVGTVLTGAILNSAVIVRNGPGGGFSDSVDLATNYVATHNFPTAPSTNFAVWINQTAFNWTITPVNTVTFIGNLSSGNFVIPANSQRTMTIEINSVVAPTITIYG